MDEKMIEFFNSNYQAKMMYLLASHYRMVMMDDSSLSINGIKINKFKEHLSSIKKMFKFAAECEYENIIMTQLENYGKTLISSNEMDGIIYEYVTDNE